MSVGLRVVKREQIKNFLDRVDQLDEWKVLFSIFGVSLIIRLLYVTLFPTVVFGDATAYDGLAIGLIEGKGYGGGTSSYWPPGQPFFLAAIYTVFGYNPQIACIFQAFISSLTCIIIYYIGKTVINKKVGIISALIAAIYPTFILYSGMLHTETLFIFLLPLSILYLLKVHEEPSAKNLIITGVSFGLATLVRPIILGFIPFILLWMLLSSKDSKDRKKNLMKFIAIFLIAMVVVSPWTIRNYNVHQEFVLVSTNGGVCFWSGNNPDATGRVLEKGNDAMLWTIWNMTDDEVAREKLFYKKGFEFIKENPSKFLVLGAKKFAYFWGFILPFFSCYLYGYFIHPIPNWLFMLLAPLTVLPYAVVLPLAIFGIVFYQKCDKKSVLLFLLMFYYVLIHCIILSSTRYHLPLVPFLIIFAAYGACSMNRIRSEIRLGDAKTRRKIILFFLLIVGLITSWYYSTICYYSDAIKMVIDKLFN